MRGVLSSCETLATKSRQKTVREGRQRRPRHSAGSKLIGYSIAPGSPPQVANGAPARSTSTSVRSRSSRTVDGGNLYVDLPSDAPELTATPRSTTSPTSTYTARDLAVDLRQPGQPGDARRLRDQTAPETWEVVVSTRPTRRPAAASRTPIRSWSTASLFNATTGQLRHRGATSSTSPSERRTVTLDMSQSSRLASNYTCSTRR